MSGELRMFERAGRLSAVALPFDLGQMTAAWGATRRAMLRSVPEGFHRDEWAYLVQFVEEKKLEGIFRAAFGDPSGVSGGASLVLFRPRGPVAIWLPSNVSMLGPLMLVMLSLVGSETVVKVSSRGLDLTSAFLELTRRIAPAGPLLDFLHRVRLERIDRLHPGNHEMARRAAVRIAFGTDAAIRAIESLPHPLESRFLGFANRRSEAWLDEAAIRDETVDALIRAFNTHGRNACTSPSRVVVLGGSETSALRLREAVLRRWLAVVRRDPEPHVATESILARQWAAAEGWDAQCVARHAAVVGVGNHALKDIEAARFLAIVPSTLDAALAHLPSNVQTIGHGFSGALPGEIVAAIGRCQVKRLVPLGRMHDFGGVWDGLPLFEDLWEPVPIS